MNVAIQVWYCLPKNQKLVKVSINCGPSVWEADTYTI